MRAREKASLQCIQCQDFGELSRRVPSFFRYLSEQLAARLLHSTELSLSKSHCLELSGSLSNFDLVTIYQTIRNSVQTGELAISDESGQLMASFFFKEGHPHSGQFQHLTGNEALWELFSARRWLEHFRSRPRSTAKRLHPGSGDQWPEGHILITAVRYRDEFDVLREKYPDKSMVLRRRKLNFSWPSDADPALQPVAEQIWQLAYTRPLSLETLYRNVRPVS